MTTALAALSAKVDALTAKVTALSNLVDQMNSASQSSSSGLFGSEGVIVDAVKWVPVEYLWIAGFAAAIVAIIYFAKGAKAL